MSFVRRGADPENIVLFACNFSAMPRHDYRVGAPVSGVWTEILNSDAADYGGSGMGNFGAVETSANAMHGRPWSLGLTLPPLAVVAFRAPRSQLPLRGAHLDRHDDALSASADPHFQHHPSRL